ncbi:MAG TPA: beta-N-acetylhexosaminidase [Nevskiaceae bacterium]|nr:beta-N-acetylhexosaminidase [Nevskiaceae bacterium]
MKTIGPLMVDIAGTQLAPEDREVLAHPLVGGVILFARNYADHAQVTDLCAQLAALKQPRLLIAVDHEGGRVQRFRVGFTRVPAMATLDKLYDESPLRATTQARDYGNTIGRELAAVGIDLCFAPVLDCEVGISRIIGDRAFSTDPQRVVVLARAFRAGLGAAGLAATGKHFPGHGGVAADSHQELPVDRRPLEQIAARDLLPFKALIGDGLESVMSAHVRYPAVDDQQPASFSRVWIRGMLRHELGFNGALFCDDLSMGGAKVVGELEYRARLALEVGSDMLPVCNDRAGVVCLLDALPEKPRRLASARLEHLYRRVVA